MIFNSCNCVGLSSSISRRGVLCAGGAGFVSALIGTLIGTSQTAQAQALGSRVPEVEWLAVRMVTDNAVIQFVPSEKRGSLTIERRTAGNQTPDAPPRTALTEPPPGYQTPSPDQPYGLSKSTTTTKPKAENYLETHGTAEGR